MTPRSAESPTARVLVLDDEAVQRMTVHVQLSKNIQCIDFGEPTTALEYLQHHQVDAAIVDLRMPGMATDGIWFLRELRERDRELGVVLRTADDGMETAEIGIESRAVQRIIKSAPDAKARLRNAVDIAINETRERRKLQVLAAGAERSREQLLKLVGRADGEITTSELCRGFVQDLTNCAATVAGYAELFTEHPAVNNRELRDLAEKNCAAARSLSDRFTDFIETPYFDPAASGSTVNQCLEALSNVFRTHQLLGGERRFNCRGMLPDVWFSASPVRLLRVLRHVVEYCALHSSSNAPVTAFGIRSMPLAKEVAATPPELVVNGRWAPTSTCLVIGIRGNLIGEMTVGRDLQTAPSDPLVGNLAAASRLLFEEKLMMSVSQAKDGSVTFNCYLPLAE